MKVIQIRGTSGSGKTMVMRSVMDSLTTPERGLDGAWMPIAIAGRKRPLYYVRYHPTVYVIGHYERPCGGGDTIGSARAIYDLVCEIGNGMILCEGLLLSEDVKWTTRLKDEGCEVVCFFLTTPVDRCVEQVKKRRESAGNEEPFNEKNTRGRVDVIERSRVRLLEAGVRCVRCSARQAAGLILNEVRLHAD